MGATLSIRSRTLELRSELSSVSDPLALDCALDAARAHVPRLLAVARKILGSDDLAWDAVQESLILLWHETHAPADLVGWLVRTVVHRSLHHARSQRRRRRHEERGALDPFSPRGSEDPQRSAELIELAELIERSLERLPERFAAVLRLRELEGLEYDEIASRIDVPVGTVRSRLHRGRALLKAQLAELVHESAECWICELETRG